MYIPPITDLVARAKKGSADAVGALYEQYCQIIFRYLYYRVGDQQTAEDLTSEVFLKMVQVLPKQDLSSSYFRSWLFQVARNLSIDHFRKNRIHPTIMITEELTVDDGPVELLTQINLDHKKLLEALKTLNEDQRDVLIFRFIDGISIGEVARVLKKSEDAVKGLQRRGLINLRQSLKELEDRHDGS
jgi:RNA polymerase sigma-70 factor, ECF subfamily